MINNRKMQIKTMRQYYLLSNQNIKIQNTWKMPRVDNDVEQQEFSHLTVGVSVSSTASKNSLVLSPEVEDLYTL